MTVIILSNNEEVLVGYNQCSFSEGAIECPRVTAGCKTGEGYELCSPQTHSEVSAAALVPEGNEGGIAFLYGHYWSCHDCQVALVAKGIKTIILTQKAVELGEAIVDAMGSKPFRTDDHVR
jgi:deoxycytidylate deaminase